MGPQSKGSTGPAFRPVSVVSSEPVHEPRRGRLVAGLVIGVVVLVFGFAAVVIIRYHPVEAASALAPGRFVDRAPGGRDPSEPVRFRFQSGRGTSVGVLLRNDGRLAIRLEDVQIQGEGVGAILRQTKARLPLGERSRSIDPEETRSFESIGLDPGEAQWVVLVLRFGERCPRGEAGAVGALRIRYTVFELPKRMRVPLREGLRVPCRART